MKKWKALGTEIYFYGDKAPTNLKQFIWVEVSETPSSPQKPSQDKQGKPAKAPDKTSSGKA